MASIVALACARALMEIISQGICRVQAHPTVPMGLLLSLLAITLAWDLSFGARVQDPTLVNRLSRAKYLQVARAIPCRPRRRK